MQEKIFFRFTTSNTDACQLPKYINLSYVKVTGPRAVKYMLKNNDEDKRWNTNDAIPPVPTMLSYCQHVPNYCADKNTI